MAEQCDGEAEAEGVGGMRILLEVLIPLDILVGLMALFLLVVDRGEKRG